MSLSNTVNHHEKKLDSEVVPDMLGSSNTDSEANIRPQKTQESLPLKSTLDRYINADWNSNELQESPEKNHTKESAIVPLIAQNSEEVSDSYIEGNTSLYHSQKIMSAPYGNDGTILYDDQCYSTSGWTSQNSWSGDMLVTEIQSEVDLQLSSARYISGAIPDLGVYSHGPMFTKTFGQSGVGYPAAVRHGLNLEVDFEHQYSYGYMGDVGVAIYDTQEQPKIIFRAWVHDAWYATKTTVNAAYYYYYGGYTKHQVEKSGSWSGTVRIWYDQNAQAVKANVLGSTITLANNLAEHELNRFSSKLAIYFSNKQSYNYQSKFIDSIFVSADTSSVTELPAYPLTPAMEGHWFPKAGYSRIYFKVRNPYSIDQQTGFGLRMKIVCDQDSFDRILTVTVDGLVVYDEVISTRNGFDGVVWVPGSFTRKVMIQIRWGGYVEKGWKLVHFCPERYNMEPLEILGEYFPKEGISHLTYQVRAGTDTELSLELDSDQDGIARYIRVYIDGQLKHTRAGDGAWIFSLGDYTDDSIHEVTLELEYGGYAEWGKILTINRIHHFAGAVEIDYMEGHCPSNEDLDVLEAYFIYLDYHRAEFHMDQQVPYIYELDLGNRETGLSQQYLSYENSYRQHSGTDWEWMLFIHYGLWNVASILLGLHFGGNMGIVMHDQFIIDYSNWLFSPSLSAFRRTVMLHEYGHHINIIDREHDGDERYCVNDYCTMSAVDVGFWFNVLSYPWYCDHHWSEHKWP